jgi:hypothetical protein
VHITLDYRFIPMAWRLKSGFSVDTFERGQARSKRLAEYLTVYLQHFAPAHRTKTNELVEFLENPDEGRVIVYFGLSYFGKPCGFATLMFYPDSNLGVVDHVAVAPTARGYGAFFSFCELIAEYLDRNNFALNYLVAEIMLGDQPFVTGFTPLTLIRLMRFLGFRVANLPYYAPDPAMVRDKDSCRAALMVISQPDKAAMGSEELLELLRVVYFKHYGDWYRRVMAAEKYSEYERVIVKSFDEIKEYVRATKTIKINGMKNFELPYVVEPGSKVSVGFVGYIVLIALPATLTIALAIEQETRLTAAVAIVTGIIFCLTLIPRCRRFVLKFFQLER